jgi:signal transduction histidine kinase
MSVIFAQQPTMLATVAHELRNPISALQAASELLDRDFEILEAGQKRALIGELRRRVVSLRALTENLLSAAAIRDGRLSVVLRPVDIRVVVNDVTALVGPILDRKQQRVRARTGRIALIAADERRIGQVLTNLLTNASKYSAAGTKIDVSASLSTRGHVRVAVSDRGPGIDRALMQRLFEPYERAGRTDGDGFGIGLSVVRSIIDAHHGRVGVKSRPGGGTTFWFEIPATSTSAGGANDLVQSVATQMRSVVG